MKTLDKGHGNSAGGKSVIDQAAHHSGHGQQMISRISRECDFIDVSCLGPPYCNWAPFLLLYSF